MPRPGEDRSNVGGAAQFQYRTCPAFKWPLAENHQRRYRERVSVQAWRHSFLAGIFGESTSFYQKSAETTTLFVKRTTKADGSAAGYKEKSGTPLLRERCKEGRSRQARAHDQAGQGQGGGKHSSIAARKY